MIINGANSSYRDITQLQEQDFLFRSRMLYTRDGGDWYRVASQKWKQMPEIENVNFALEEVGEKLDQRRAQAFFPHWIFLQNLLSGKLEGLLKWIQKIVWLALKLQRKIFRCMRSRWEDSTLGEKYVFARSRDQRAWREEKGCTYRCQNSCDIWFFFKQNGISKNANWRISKSWFFFQIGGELAGDFPISCSNRCYIGFTAYEWWPLWGLFLSILTLPLRYGSYS